MSNRPVDPLVPGAIGGFDHAKDANKFAHYDLWGCVAGERSGTFQRESDDPDDYVATGDADLAAASPGADGIRSRTPPLKPLGYATPPRRAFDVCDYDEAATVQLGGKDPFANKLLYQARQAAWMVRRARVISAKRHAAWLGQGAAVFNPDSIDRAGSPITDATELDGMLVDGARKSGADTLFCNERMFDLVRRHPSVIGKLPDNVTQIHDEGSLVENYLAPQLGVKRIVVTRAHDNPKRLTDYCFGDHLVLARTEQTGVSRDPLVPTDHFMVPVNCAGAVRVMRPVNYWDEAEMRIGHGTVLSNPSAVPNEDARRRLAGLAYVVGQYQVESNSKKHGVISAEGWSLLDRTAIYTILNGNG